MDIFTKEERRMLHKIETYVSKWNMIQKEDKIVVGISGGADSVCLLFVLLELRKKLPFDLVAVHVNHGIRGEEADADEAYVQALCEQYQVTLYKYYEDVKKISEERKLSEEEAGREVRRKCFRQTMEACGGTRIALAHHMNDNVETFFLNLARGSGVKGLGAIRPVNGEIIRPLLCLERKEIEHYLKEHQIPYCTDSSNAEDAYTRNRIRNNIVPYLQKEVNAGVVPHVAQAIEQLQETEEYLAEQVRFYLKECVKVTENGYILDEIAYGEVPQYLQSRVMKEILAQVSEKEKDLSMVHVKALQDLLSRQVGRRVELPYAVEAKRIYEGLRIGKRSEKKAKATISFRVIENNETIAKEREKNDTKLFDYDIISQKICIRTRREGDYITIHPDGRRQKLKSFFINEKIPEEMRDEIYLVADGSHILWIVGYRTNPLYQVHAGTRQILEVTIDKGEE